MQPERGPQHLGDATPSDSATRADTIGAAVATALRARLRRVELNLTRYFAHIVRDHGQGFFEDDCCTFLGPDNVFATHDYWGKMKCRKVNQGVCEDNAAGLSCHGSHLVYRNPTAAQRAAWTTEFDLAEAYWDEFPTPLDAGGPVFCVENTHSLCNDSKQTTFHTHGVLSAEFADLRKRRPFLKNFAGTQSDQASNYHSTDAFIAEFDMQRGSFRVWSEPGEGKDKVDADKGKTVPRLLRALAAGFNQEDDEENYHALEWAAVAGQVNGVLKLPRENEDEAPSSRKTFPNAESVYCLAIDKEGITVWEQYDHEHFETTGKLAGYGPGKRYTAAMLDVYRVQKRAPAARIEHPAAPSAMPAASFAVPAPSFAVPAAPPAPPIASAPTTVTALSTPMNLRAAFMASPTFGGPRPGFVFTTRSGRVGYHRDTHSSEGAPSARPTAAVALNGASAAAGTSTPTSAPAAHTTSRTTAVTVTRTSACAESARAHDSARAQASSRPPRAPTVAGCQSREQKRMTKQENVNAKRVKSEAKEAQRSAQDARDAAIVRSVTNRSGEAFSCSNCPKSFLTRNGLDEHERSGTCTRAAESKAVRHVARSAVEQLRTTDLAMRASDATRASATSLVTVKFGSTDLGISVDDRLRVVVITPGGAADRSMRIDRGFQIVRVDGADASAATIVASVAAAISSAGTVDVLFRRSRPQLPRHGTARRALYRTAQTTFTPEQKSWLETEVFHNQRQRVRDRRAYIMMREQFRDRVGNDGKPLWLEQSQIASWISRQWAVLKASARVCGAAAARARAAAVAAATAGAGGVVAASAAADEGGAAVAGSTADNTGGEDDDGEENGGGAMMDGDGDAAANGDHADGDAADQGDDADDDDADGDGNDDENLDRLTCKELRERLKAVGLDSVVRKADLTEGRKARDVLLGRLIEQPDVY